MLINSPLLPDRETVSTVSLFGHGLNRSSPAETVPRCKIIFQVGNQFSCRDKFLWERITHLNLFPLRTSMWSPGPSTRITRGNVSCQVWVLHGSIPYTSNTLPRLLASTNCRTTEQSRLEKTFKILGSNHQPALPSPLTKWAHLPGSQFPIPGTGIKGTCMQQACKHTLPEHTPCDTWAQPKCFCSSLGLQGMWPWPCEERISHSHTGSLSVSCWSTAGGRYLRLARILFRMLRSSKAEISASCRKEEDKFFTGRHRHHLISSLVILWDWWSRSASLRVSVWCGCALTMKPIWPSGSTGTSDWELFLLHTHQCHQ